MLIKTLGVASGRSQCRRADGYHAGVHGRAEHAWSICRRRRHGGKSQAALLQRNHCVHRRPVPREEVLVRPDREGLQVALANAEVGDNVSSGQVLAQLTAPDGTGPTDVRAPSEGIILKAAA